MLIQPHHQLNPHNKQPDNHSDAPPSPKGFYDHHIPRFNMLLARSKLLLENLKVCNLKLLFLVLIMLPYCKIIISVAVFILNMKITRGVPDKISPLVIPDTTGECPSNDRRQAYRNILRYGMREILENSLANAVSLNCGSGEWRNVLYVNASRSCPFDWSLHTSPVRGCAGAGSSCRSAFSDDISIPYTKVCGRITGEALMSPDAFFRRQSNQITIEGNYLDGVSVTHGLAGSRTHIWSFGTGHPAISALNFITRCPCGTDDRSQAPLPPAEVGNNYFCDRADELDPIWTGESCSNNNSCCLFHNPPYFSVQLPAATTDKIELRICTDSNPTDEVVLVRFAEIYVQ